MLLGRCETIFDEIYETEAVSRVLETLEAAYEVVKNLDEPERVLLSIQVVVQKPAREAFGAPGDEAEAE